MQVISTHYDCIAPHRWLSLLLRDRTTYEPHLSQFNIFRIKYDYYDDDDDDSFIRTNFAREEIAYSYGSTYNYCGNEDNGIKSKYSPELFKELDRIYAALGEDS